LQRSYSGGVAASGTIARTAPFTADDALAAPTQIDANSPSYSGSPYGFGIRRL
jgi:hypothetical protein